MQLGLKVACALAIAAITMGLSSTIDADPLKVKTEQGKVAGRLQIHPRYERVQAGFRPEMTDLSIR